MLGRVARSWLFPDESVTLTELACSHNLPFSLKSQNLILELSADECEWEVTPPHFESDRQGGGPATRLGAAAPDIWLSQGKRPCVCSVTLPRVDSYFQP